MEDGNLSVSGTIAQVHRPIASWWAVMIQFIAQITHFFSSAGQEAQVRTYVRISSIAIF